MTNEEKQVLLAARPSNLISGPFLRGVVEERMRQVKQAREEQPALEFMNKIMGTQDADTAEALMKDLRSLLVAVIAYLDQEYLKRHNFTAEDLAQANEETPAV